MPGINSLGIGSGVLTSDLIDQLREADDNVIIKPLESKIELANQKEDAYALLSSLMTNFQSSTTALNSDELYLNRAVNGSTDEVTVKASSGTNVQSFSITDVDRAEKDIWNSADIASHDEAIDGLGEGTLSLSIDGDDYNIEYTASSTLDSIKDSINEVANSVMTASVLQVGEDQYELILTAKDTNKAISFSDTTLQLDTITLTNDIEAADTLSWGDGTNTVTLDQADGGLSIADDPTAVGVKMAAAINADENLKLLYKATAVDGGFTVESLIPGTVFTGTTSSSPAENSSQTTTSSADDSLLNTLQLANIQPAEAATFKYNGINITRDSNQISDMIVGVTLTLNSNQVPSDSETDTPGIATINISQNSTSVSTEMSLLVSSYNSLMTNIDDMTNSDRETGATGIFNSESFVKTIKTDINRMMLQMDNNRVSLVDYGIDLDREGVMSFDANVFNTKFQADPAALELFFSGSYAVSAKDATSTTEAVAAKDEVEGIFTKLDAQMINYTGYKLLMDSFEDQLTSTKVSITDQYDKQKASLDSRYEIMTTKFIAYDAIISQLNNSFSVLESAIEAQYVDN